MDFLTIIFLIKFPKFGYNIQTLTYRYYRLIPFSMEGQPGQLSRYSDSLRTGRSGDRIPVGARFSVPVQTGAGTNPASCTMGTGSFPGVKRAGRGADHPHPSKCRGHERVELYLYSPSGPQWPVIGRTFTFTFTFMEGKIFAHFKTKFQGLNFEFSVVSELDLD